MSAEYYKIKQYYDLGRWTKQQVRDAVDCGAITAKEYKRITGEDY